MNTTKDKIITFRLCFQSNLISIEKWFRNFFNDVACIIINSKLSWILNYYSLNALHTLFIIMLRRNKIKCYCQFNFLRIRFFEIIYDVFQVWSNFILLLIGFYFYHLYFCIQNNCCSKNYQLLLVCNNLTVFDLFFMLKKVPNISHYFVFNYFIFFFLSRKISDIFNYSVMYFFTKSKSISYIFFLIFFKP